MFIHEKYLLSISSVLFIVHLRMINALKCHAGITQKYVRDVSEALEVRFLITKKNEG